MWRWKDTEVLISGGDHYEYSQSDRKKCKKDRCRG